MNLSESLPIERGTVLSADGAAVSYMCLGSGTPLVVCHGSFAMAQDWLCFAEHMAATRKVYLYDRRGRGQNPCAAPESAIVTEVDDLAAMVDLAGPGTALLGHSHGGGCALSFAVRNGFAGQLILYEPRHSVRGPVSGGHIPEIERLIAAGDEEATIEFILGHVVGMPADAIAGVRQTLLWERMCQTVDAFPNELRFVDSLAWRPGDLDGIASTPSLLVGEQSPVPPDDIAALRSLLPVVRMASLPGQGHFAYMDDPGALANIVNRCLSRTEADT